MNKDIASALREAASVLQANAPSNMRFPLVDELYGFASMIENRKPLPESVKEALAFYSENSVNYLTTREQIQAHENSPNWEQEGELYNGDVRFVITTAKAENALQELKEWEQNETCKS